MLVEHGLKTISVRLTGYRPRCGGGEPRNPFGAAYRFADQRIAVLNIRNRFPGT
jgi:hypothetical protein